MFPFFDALAFFIKAILICIVQKIIESEVVQSKFILRAQWLEHIFTISHSSNRLWRRESAITYSIRTPYYLRGASSVLKAVLCYTLNWFLPDSSILHDASCFSSPPLLMAAQSDSRDLCCRMSKAVLTFVLGHRTGCIRCCVCGPNGAITSSLSVVKCCL